VFRPNWSSRQIVLRVVSLFVVALYLAASLVSDVSEHYRVLAFRSILPLACIWFPDEIAAFYEGIGMTRSPALLVSLMGWVLLAVPFIQLRSWYSAISW